MLTGRWRSGALAAGWIVLLGLTLLALDTFARNEFTRHLRDQAAHALALAATTASPYQWRFKAADDLVGGQPSDAGDFAFREGALAIRRQARPFEIALPLARPISLRNFPLLHLRFDADVPGTLQIVIREKGNGSELLSVATLFEKTGFDASVDLATIAWSANDGAEPHRAPATAAEIRIRWQPASSGAFVIHGVSLQRDSAYVPLDLKGPLRVADPQEAAAMTVLTFFRLPFAPQAQTQDIDAIAANARVGAPPLILLPQRGRVEQQIALRNAVYNALPAAILIPETQYVQSVEEARALAIGELAPVPASTQWRVVALFAALLLAIRVRSPRNPRLRALLEIALTLAPPAWIIVGGNFDGRLHAPQAVLIALTLLYAVSLSVPRVWRWNGPPRAWAYAGLVVLLALAIIAVLGHRAAEAPNLRPIARYLGWALLQQYLVCAVCTERWRIVTGSSMLATYLGALGFAILHTPNAALMLATFVGGLCWCAIYLRYRALLPLAFSHAASALLLAKLLPSDILHSAEVSARFFQ